MVANIIDGRKIAERIKLSVKSDIKNIKATQKTTPELAMLEIGKNPSVEIYLKSQIKLAGELGIKYSPMILPARASQREIEQKIDRLNKNEDIAGIIIQRPVPRHMDFARLCALIAPNKDVEGLNPINIGRLIYEDWIIAPCTASACMALIDSTGINLYGKEAVIIGHSEIVGKPLSLMLLSRMATTTVCHIGTYQKRLLKSHVQRAEVLIVSVGKSHLIKGDWIRKEAIVIDVGINRHKGKVTGDVDFKGAVKRASYITPVPGGVGPVTTIMLMKNLVALYKNRASHCRQAGKCRP